VIKPPARHSFRPPKAEGRRTHQCFAASANIFAFSGFVRGNWPSFVRLNERAMNGLSLISVALSRLPRAPAPHAGGHQYGDEPFRSSGHAATSRPSSVCTRPSTSFQFQAAHGERVRYRLFAHMRSARRLPDFVPDGP